ncbi:MAG: 5-bromo-4-chloroindolyl phosphate hydrolysis family protein [Oscillospiraceae bacterium]|nr:5-bromo-4-chloroindolyl phosphate hydrolysis family protein [Oscillospiraceae bacterium]
MSSSEKRRYKQEARNAANRARNTAERFFQQNAEAAQRGAEAARQAADAAARQAADSTRQQAQGSTGGTYHYQYRQAAQSQQKQPPKAEPWEQEAQPDAWNQSERDRKRARKKAGRGTGLIIAGSIVSGIFALGSAAISIDILQMIVHGYGWADEFIGLLACMMFLAGGLGMLFSGIGKNRSSERYLNYLAYIGANREVALAPMAASFGVPVSKLCKDLRRMLAKGILPTGYLDLAEGKLFLTEMGYHTPEPKRETPPVQEETAQEAAAREDDILREIRQVNDAIPDAAMSAKIDRIEEITGKILKYQKEHPNKEGQLRTFLNYYLPTTLKILRAYAQLDAQGIEGENISAAKKRIEDMMDQVVSGFEKQLDKLFQDDAMDITSDVEVLENMLKKDGLSDEGGITMTL